MPGTRLTHAARRSSTSWRAIFSASSTLDAVLSTTILSVIFQFLFSRISIRWYYLFFGQLHEIVICKTRLCGGRSGGRGLRLCHLARGCSGINAEAERNPDVGEAERRSGAR